MTIPRTCSKCGRCIRRKSELCWMCDAAYDLKVQRKARAKAKYQRARVGNIGHRYTDPERQRVPVCGTCFNLTDRRPKDRLCKCGLPYAELPPITRAPVLRSSIGGECGWNRW